LLTNRHMILERSQKRNPNDMERMFGKIFLTNDYTLIYFSQQVR